MAEIQRNLNKLQILKAFFMLIYDQKSSWVYSAKLEKLFSLYKPTNWA